MLPIQATGLKYKCIVKTERGLPQPTAAGRRRQGAAGQGGAYLLRARGRGWGLSRAAAGPSIGGAASWCSPSLRACGGALQWLRGGGRLTPHRLAPPAPHAAPPPAPPSPLSKSTGALAASSVQRAQLAHSWPAGLGYGGGSLSLQLQNLWLSRGRTRRGCRSDLRIPAGALSLTQGGGSCRKQKAMG